MKNEDDELTFGATGAENSGAGGGAKSSAGGDGSGQGVESEENILDGLAAVLEEQAAADSLVRMEYIKKNEYLRIVERRKRRAYSFNLFLCAFLVLFIIFMAFNISRLAGERASRPDRPGSYRQSSGAAEDFYESELPAPRGGYADPLYLLAFFAAEGAALFVIFAALAFVFRFAYSKLGGARRKTGALF